MEWVIAHDQLFKEVEKPEFIAMINYTHHTGMLVKIPKRNGIKLSLIKMGDQMIEDVRKMFLVGYLYLLIVYYADSRIDPERKG